MDSVDSRILKALSADARVTNSELAKRVGMTPPGVLDRVRKLEKHGIIEGYETRINARKVGLGMTALVMVHTNEKVGETAVGDALAKLLEAQEIYYLTGEFCYQMKVRVRDTEDLARFLEKVGSIPKVRDSLTTLVLKTIKETLALRLDDSKEV